MTGTLQLGDLRIDRIVEGEAALAPALNLLRGLTPEVLAENRAWLQPQGLDAEDKLRVLFTSCVVRTPHHTILIDTCGGNDKPRPDFPPLHMKNDTRFMDGLAAAGVAPEQVDFVLCSHLHVDHVGWNTKLQDGRWVPTFPNARYVFGRTEYDYWQAKNAEAENPVFVDSVLPVVQAGRAEMVDSEHAIGDHLQLLPTAGHTPGHVSVLLGKGRAEAVYSGDVIHSPLQARYPELSMAFDVDPEQSAVTRRSFLERFAETDTVCCFNHFALDPVGRVQRWGNGFRCEPVGA
ncbi:MAG: MBL fold metallo-hydrolase [Acetobacteraceae bacterium]|nr:MBL fold metallo-hydrolase [Acetobacteraceae bacterium]